MSPKVSVVIPVYNVEKYLRNCIDSVLAQTYKNYEIILVDDGSTDNSGRICDEYIANNIRVIHKENGGLSDARNTGTTIATGQYVTWIDSDDTIHKDFLKILIEMAEKNNSDLSCAEILSYQEGDEPTIPSKDYVTKVMSGLDALKLMLEGTLHGTSACCLLVKKTLALKYKFPLKKYHEDDYTTYHYFLEANSVSYTNEPLYFYLQREDSIMHKPFSQIDIDELDAADEIYRECSELGDEYKEAAFVKKTGNYLQILFKFKDLKSINIETYERIMMFIKQNRRNILNNKNIKTKQKIRLFLYRMHLLEITTVVFKKIKKVIT